SGSSYRCGAVVKRCRNRTIDLIPYPQMSSLNRIVVSGYEALRTEISKWSDGGKKGRLVLLFLSDHVDGKGWCPDCVTVEPLVDEAVKDAAVVAATASGDVTVVQAFVGQKEAWKDKTNSFRTSEDLLVDSIPTLLEYGKLDRRLGDKECTTAEIIKNFILGL
ncbi:hypothetical protein PFISCL1PPCAC_9324, partial [Pristionchus fissidentatus]